MLSEKLRSTTGRVCPEHVNGVCRAITDGAKKNKEIKRGEIEEEWDNLTVNQIDQFREFDKTYQETRLFPWEEEKTERRTGEKRRRSTAETGRSRMVL